VGESIQSDKKKLQEKIDAHEKAKKFVLGETAKELSEASFEELSQEEYGKEKKIKESKIAELTQ